MLIPGLVVAASSPFAPHRLCSPASASLSPLSSVRPLASVVAFVAARLATLQGLDPRLREAIKTQEFFQDLESWEPILGQMPCGPAKFSDSRVPKPQILEEIARCARHDDYHGRRKSGFCAWQRENEDPAKMTYSIPDFLSRDEANVTTDSLFGGPARETVYLRPGSERESIHGPLSRPYWGPVYCTP